MKTLYLHIGTPKTGTSALQKFCIDNSEVLEKKGYCFRLMPFGYSDRPSRNRNGHFLVGKVYEQGNKVDKRATEERTRQGYDIVAGWLREMDHVILSEESIWNSLNGKRWKILDDVMEFCRKQGAELKVIVYVRRQDDFLSSWWRQMIRVGRHVDTWEEVAAHPPKRIILDYYTHLKRIGEIVGKENLIVRRYEKGSFRGEGHTIFSDFLDVVGLPFTDDFTIQQETVNSSMNNNYAEMKRILNDLQEEGAVVNNDVSRFFERAVLFCSRRESSREKYSLFSPEEREAFLKRYEEGNQKILEEYLQGEEVLFHTGGETLPKWNRDNPDVYADTVLYFGKIALDQEQRIRELEKQLKETRKQMDGFQKEHRSDLRALKKLLVPVRKVRGLVKKRQP